MQEVLIKCFGDEPLKGLVVVLVTFLLTKMTHAPALNGLLFQLGFLLSSPYLKRK